MKDQVFSIADGEWQVMLSGHLLPHIWNSKGAARAGLETERRRAQAIRDASRADDGTRIDTPTAVALMMKIGS